MRHAYGRGSLAARPLGVAAPILLSAWLRAGNASACSCPDYRVLAPVDANAAFVMGPNGPVVVEEILPPMSLRPGLVDAAGNAIAVTATEISHPTVAGSRPIHILRPVAPLPAGEHLKLEIVPFFGGQVFPADEWDVVVEEPPPGPPPVPRITGVEYVSADLGYSYTFHNAWLTLEETTEFVVADLGGRAALDAEAFTGSVSAVKGDGLLSVGNGCCLRAWPEAGPGSSTTVRLGQFDLGGQFSGWSDPVVLRGFDAPRSSGCAAARAAPRPGDALGLCVLALGVALGIRRRRTG